MIKEKAIDLYKEENEKCEMKSFDLLTDTKIETFEKKYDVKLEKNFVEWLRVANGSNVGPGGFFGIETGRNTNNIEFYLTLYPIWIELKYIPIASDGFGNTYLIDLSNSITNGFIFFIDSYSDLNKPTYYVASNIWTFLYFILGRNEKQEDIDDDEWPFNKKKVTAVDPKILKAPKGLLPWNLAD
jgi:cell wall assembly regulator SMI1